MSTAPHSFDESFGLPEPYSVEYFDYESALREASDEALRDLAVRPDSISYVGYVHVFHDYCFCEFAPEDKGWTKAIRSLLPRGRLAAEEIQDQTIIQLARRGSMTSAVLLCRTKHQVALKEAVDAVNTLKSQDA